MPSAAAWARKCAQSRSSIWRKTKDAMSAPRLRDDLAVPERPSRPDFVGRQILDVVLDQLRVSAGLPNVNAPCRAERVFGLFRCRPVGFETEMAGVDRRSPQS